METRLGRASRTLFLGLIYALIYMAMQLLPYIFIALFSLTGDTVTGYEDIYGLVLKNLFPCTFAAMAAALVLYILLGLLRERPVLGELKVKGISQSQAGGAIALAFGLRLAVSVYTVLSDEIPALKDSLESAPDISPALSSPLNILFALLIMNIAAPVFEEVLFRGFIQTELMRGFPSPAAIVISSLIFAVFHGNLFQSTFVFFVGLCLGFCFYKTGSLLTSIILHIIFNSSAALQYLALMLPPWALVIEAVIGAAAIYLGIRLVKRKDC